MIIIDRWVKLFYVLVPSIVLLTILFETQISAQQVAEWTEIGIWQTTTSDILIEIEYIAGDCNV